MFATISTLNSYDLLRVGSILRVKTNLLEHHSSNGLQHGAEESCTTSVARQALLIGFVSLASYAYFYQGGGWNTNSRFDLTRAILERHTLSIDAYHQNTQDKALYQGHYYSDKAPGQVLVALPAAAAVRTTLRLAGKDPLSPRSLLLTSYFASLFSSGLPAALACVLLFLICLRLGASMNAAALGALAMGLATPMWAYGTLMLAHALAGACLLLAFAAALQLSSASSNSSLLWAVIITGMAASWAVVTEYPAAPAAAIVIALALSSIWTERPSIRTRILLGITLGALPCVLVLMAYQYAAFGSPWRLGYTQYPAGSFTWMRHGLLGLTYPRPWVVLKLLFGPRRGLFFAAPIAAVAPYGLWLLYKSPEYKRPAIAAAGIFVYYLLFNASFPVWTAGWSYGPRYMGAAIPVLCLGIAPMWDFARHRGKQVLLLLLFASVLFSLIAVATDANPSDAYHHPMTELLWPSFWHGHLSLSTASMLTPAEENGSHAYGAFNLGQLVGLRGLPSLLPLLAVWAVAGFLWCKTKRAASSA